MRLLFIVIIIALCLSLAGKSDAGETKVVIVGKPVTVSTVCLNGYLFAVAGNKSMAGGIDIEQMYRKGAGPSRPPQPILCD